MSVAILYAEKTPRRVKPHVQAWADTANTMASVGHFGTYNGHSPNSEQALDAFPKSPSEGDKLALATIKPDVMARFGIDYRIWSFNRRTGSIYNPEVAPHEREMRDRGSPTQNHVDHVHVSFLATVSGALQPQPTPGELELTVGQFETLQQKMDDQHGEDMNLGHNQSQVKLDQIAAQLGVLPVILEAIKADDDGNIVAISDADAAKIAKAVQAQMGEENAKAVAERILNG